MNLLLSSQIDHELGQTSSNVLKTKEIKVQKNKVLQSDVDSLLRSSHSEVSKLLQDAFKGNSNFAKGVKQIANSQSLTLDQKKQEVRDLYVVYYPEMIFELQSKWIYKIDPSFASFVASMNLGRAVPSIKSLPVDESIVRAIARCSPVVLDSITQIFKSAQKRAFLNVVDPDGKILKAIENRYDQLNSETN